jgi:hypothetical protein
MFSSRAGLTEGDALQWEGKKDAVSQPHQDLG